MSRLCMGCMKEYDEQFAVCPYCGYAYDTKREQSYHIPPGSILRNRYIVGKVLGFGGFGITYLGWDYVMERKVAIKEYLPSEFATRMPTQLRVTIYSGDREEQYREGLRKTLDEAKRLAKFESVPGIVQIYDCFEENDTSYIIMEFLEGVSLKTYLAEQGRMSPEQALPVIEQIASAMEKVHEKGILHRDIAPDNIYVLNPDEPDQLQVKLLDFGAARYATTKHSKSLSVIIKPGYAPEEQYRSRGDQGTWTDVYALAATLYKMLTDVTPEDAMERSVKDELKKPSKLGVKLTKATETALMNALNVKIQDRTQTMQEFSQELMAAEVRERAVTKDRRDVGAVPKWVLGVCGGGLVVAAAAVVLILNGFFGGIRTEQVVIEDTKTRVPNVVNEEIAAAETMLSERELLMNQEKADYNEEIPENMIWYQEQADNTIIEKGATIDVWVSIGKKKAFLPALTNRTREEATELLREAGFENVRIEESTNEGIFDTVLAVSAPEREMVPLSDEIVLTICVNQESQKGDASVQVAMLNVTGKDYEEAKKQLEEAGFRVSKIEENSDLPVGTVTAQSVENGQKVNHGSSITLTVSLGAAKVAVPNVYLIAQDRAIQTLESQGLRAGAITEEYSDTIDAGKVIGQSIEPDTMVEKGTAVALTISKGPDPETLRKREEEAKRRREAAEAAERQTEENRPAATTAAPQATKPAPPETQPAPQPTEPPATEPASQEQEAPQETEAPKNPIIDQLSADSWTSI